MEVDSLASLRRFHSLAQRNGKRNTLMLYLTAILSIAGNDPVYQEPQGQAVDDVGQREM